MKRQIENLTSVKFTESCAFYVIKKGPQCDAEFSDNVKVILTLHLPASLNPKTDCWGFDERLRFGYRVYVDGVSLFDINWTFDSDNKTFCRVKVFENVTYRGGFDDAISYAEAALGTLEKALIERKIAFINANAN